MRLDFGSGARIVNPEQDGKNLTWTDAITLYQFADNAFRTIIVTVSLLLALLGYATREQRFLVTVLSIFMIFFTVIYAFVIFSRVNRVMKTSQHKFRFSAIYYFTAMTVLTLISLFVVLRVDWTQSWTDKRVRFASFSSAPKN